MGATGVSTNPRRGEVTTVRSSRAPILLPAFAERRLGESVVCSPSRVDPAKPPAEKTGLPNARGRSGRSADAVSSSPQAACPSSLPPNARSAIRAFGSTLGFGIGNPPAALAAERPRPSRRAPHRVRVRVLPRRPAGGGRNAGSTPRCPLSLSARAPFPFAHAPARTAPQTDTNRKSPRIGYHPWSRTA